MYDDDDYRSDDDFDSTWYDDGSDVSDDQLESYRYAVGIY